MKRRQFMQTSLAAAGAAAVGGLPRHTLAATDKSAIQTYKTLGRTGIRMSDISFGAGRLPSASLALRAMHRGINYFDTAPDYGPSEDFLGEAMQKFGQRNKLFIASKFCHAGSYQAGVSHLHLGSTKADYIASVDNSLKRLQTDYLDIVFVHAIGEQENLEEQQKRLLDEPMLEAVEALKEQGKMRFLAVSSHGPHHMESLMTTAVESGHFDVIMPSFNFMTFPKVPEVLELAQAKGVGVVAMKTLAGAKDMKLDPKGEDFAHAAFKWTLKHPQVAGLVISIKSVGDLDHFLGASGQPFTDADQRILDRYAARYGNDYCRTGCGDCEPACAQGVNIAAILRHQMYFEDYGEEKRAMLGYAGLEKQADLCTGCSDAACNAACPYGLPVSAKLEAAHRTLAFPGLPG